MVLVGNQQNNIVTIENRIIQNRNETNDRNFRYNCELNLRSFFAEKVTEKNHLLYLRCMTPDKVTKFFFWAMGLWMFIKAKSSLSQINSGNFCSRCLSSVV